MKQLFKNLSETAEKTAHEKIIDELLKIQAANYEKAAAYMNLIIVAGYAVFYTVWAKSDKYLSDALFVTSAFLMTLSVVFPATVITGVLGAVILLLGFAWFLIGIWG